jgi:hypothetical protein
MGHVSVPVRHACSICFGLSPFPITYSPCFSSYYPLALVSSQLSRNFPSDIKRRPTQCCPHHTQFLIYVVLKVVTIAIVGTAVVLPTVAQLLAMILPTGSPLSAPIQFLFDAVHDLSKIYLNDKSSRSIKFRALPVYTLMAGLPLDMTSSRKLTFVTILVGPPCIPLLAIFTLTLKSMINLPLVDNPS